MIGLRVPLRSGARVRLGAALVIVAALAVFLVIGVRTSNRSCKGVGIGRAIGAQGDLQIETYPSPAAAVDAYVHGSPLRLTGEPVPTDGWYEDGRVWAADLPDGGRYETNVAQQIDGGWLVSGGWSICGT